MLFLLKILKGLISALHSDVSPNQVAGGAALGSIIGLTPFNTLHNYLVFFLIFVLRVNIGAAFLAIAVFGVLGLFLDPISDRIGYLLLVNAQGLTGLWTWLYNLPIVPFTRFNNTVVLGSFVLSLALLAPVFFLSKRLIVYYRANWRAKVEQWKIVKLFKLTAIFNIYDKYKQ